MDDSQSKTLGRGLSSLIGGNRAGAGEQVSGNLKAPYFPKKSGGSGTQVMYVDTSQIKLNPYQPRKEFKENALNELVQSIKIYGIIQPLIVTMVLGGGYELVAGERRLRAAKAAGLKQVPVIVRNAKELEKLELSLIENIQRHDLNPIEKADSFKKLVDEFNLTHDEASKRLGISRPHFSNFIRLLGLPVEIQKGIAEGRVSLSQAKLMLEVKDNKKQEQIYKRAMEGGQNVEDVRREVKKVKVRQYARQLNRDPQLKAWEDEMQSALGTRVKIRQRGKQGGVIEIEFYSEEELSNIVANIS